ncbi:MAG: sugar phosphate isomerase/epimerase [Clostridiales bacterium]|nr:sugar phosphate isomerase/epimerase [Clostridiales bacterium]
MKSMILCDSRNLKQTALLCNKYHLGIEAQSFWDPNYLTINPKGIEEHLEVLKDIPERTIHGPFWDLCPGSFDSLIRDVTRERFEFAYECANKINAKGIILHHGGYINGVFTHKKSIRDWSARSIQFWKDFLVDKDKSVIIYVENFLEPDPEMMFELLEAVNQENLKINLDIGHVNYSSDVPVVDWIKRLNTHIGYVHIHDNLGNADEHHELGSGNLPLVDIFNALEKYSPNAIWAIEHGTSELEISINWLKDHGYFKL